MNPAQLLAQFDRIGEAPDAIPRLRRFILDLAVRGKLVDQDPRDEPASELLKRIEVENRQVQDSNDPLAENEQPFKTPHSWAWIRIGNAAHVEMGQSPPSENYNKSGNGIPFYQGKTDFGIRHPTPRYWCNLPSKLAQKNDILISVRAPVGPTNVASEECCIGRGLAALRPRHCVNLEFLLYILKGFESAIAAIGYGTTFVAITKKQLISFVIPLPPLAEQHRIVAKVDELMALCDRLEATQTELENRRDRLVASSLNGLNNGADADAFREHARFYFNHLPRLTTRPDHIKQLRQTILNLAIRGKLVEQNPTDEPAAELLKRIQAEIPKLQKAKEISPQKPAEPNKSFEVDTKIPGSWVHAYLQDLAYQITDGTHLTPKYTEKGKPFLSAQNVKPFRFMPQKYRLVSSDHFAKYRANRKPEREDVLLTRVGAGIGEAAILDSDFEFAFYVSLCLIKVPTQLLMPYYLVLWLNSPEGRDSARTRTYGKGASQGNLNLGLIRTFRVPLPPLAEQHRIVAKVDELMALCDQLETQLTTTQSESRRLLEAVLHELLSSRPIPY